METKILSFNEMQEIVGGKNGCGLAIAGLALSIAGTAASFASLNPVGVVMGVGGIYTGGAGMIISCRLATR